MRKSFALFIAFGLGIIVGVAGGGGVMAYANSSWWERWYDTGVAECLQRVSHVAHVRSNETDRAIELIDGAIANQLEGVLGRADAIPAPASRDYGERQQQSIQLIHTYMQIYPDRFEHILKHPRLAEYPPLSVEEVRVLCERSGICRGEFASMLQQLKEQEARTLPLDDLRP